MSTAPAEAGPTLEFLCRVDDMGTARDLARLAATDSLPSKTDRIGNADPLNELASQHPGVLLWRVAASGPPRSSVPPVGQWQVGAATARALREQDVAADHESRDAALDRRHHRRGG